MFGKLAVLFTIASSTAISSRHRFVFDQVGSKVHDFQLERSIRDSIGHNRMVNTVYRSTKNQILDKSEIRQQQKTQQSELMNQYSSFFMNQLQTSSGPEGKASFSEAELKKQLKAAYRRILRQRRKELMQMYG